MDIDFPKALEEKVIARGGNIADWKIAYDSLKKNYDTLRAQYEEYSARASETIRDRGEQIKSLIGINEVIQARLKELGDNATNLPEEKPLNPKVRESLLKLVIGMAVDGYGYEPKAKKSPIPKQLTDNFAIHGISINEDTVRTWLQKAAELLPRETEIDKP